MHCITLHDTTLHYIALHTHTQRDRQTDRQPARQAARQTYTHHVSENRAPHSIHWFIIILRMGYGRIPHLLCVHTITYNLISYIIIYDHHLYECLWLYIYSVCIYTYSIHATRHTLSHILTRQDTELDVELGILETEALTVVASDRGKPTEDVEKPCGKSTSII